MKAVPMIVVEADAFAVTPATRPLNTAMTENAFAFVDGVLDNGTRMIKVVPAT
jgi:hypothetical protein